MPTDSKRPTLRSCTAQAPVVLALLDVKRDAGSAQKSEKAAAPKRTPAPSGAESPSPTYGPCGGKERAIVKILHKLNRLSRLRTLSVTEQALVAGAKINVEKLAEACGATLKRKDSDATARRPSAAPSLAQGANYSVSGKQELKS